MCGSCTIKLFYFTFILLLLQLSGALNGETTNIISLQRQHLHSASNTATFLCSLSYVYRHRSFTNTNTNTSLLTDMFIRIIITRAIFSQDNHDTRIDILMHSKSTEINVSNYGQLLYHRQEHIFLYFSQSTFKFPN